MKANQSVKGLREDQSGYTKMVGGLVALLLVIIIGDVCGIKPKRRCE
jgi:hypothetical protein